MSNLALSSLQVRQFRVFRHLEIPRLERVNLITGKNNVGKTCLLEALLIYASRPPLLTMKYLLESRNENFRLSIGAGEGEQGQSVRYFFHGRNELRAQTERIEIGSIGSAESALSIGVVWFIIQIDRDGQRRLQLLPLEDLILRYDVVPGLSVKLGTQKPFNYPLEIDIPDISRIGRVNYPQVIPHVYVPANGIGRAQVGLWDKIALTRSKDDVLASLHIIAPEVEDLNLLGTQESDGERIPMVKVAGSAVPLPLRSLGEGMNRLFGIALAMVNARDGMLLIDEVESGLHYSVHADLWRLIFQVARRLNVQVFATTHSWDCIEGFQAASEENQQVGGLLVRLDKKDEDVFATLFDEHKLAIATREDVEVR
jgi:hypothetical protein